jgi:two-component system cell cycle sensor histidine kinase/response regulator CckA
VLLVEDDPEDALIFSRYAEACPDFRVTVQHVQTCEQAEERLLAEQYDVVFLDLNLGSGLTAPEVVARLAGSGPGPPVVVLTGVAEAGTAVEMLKQGITDYLLKDDFGVEVLRRALRYAMEQGRLSSERGEAQRALEESEERFRAVLESVRDVAYRIDLQTGRFSYISPSAEEVLGFSTRELMAMGADEFTSLVHPEDVSRFQEAMERTLEGRSDAQAEAPLEYRLRGGSGGWIWVSDCRRVIRSERQLPAAVVGTLRDVTEQKEAEKERRRLEEQVRQVQKLEGLAVLAGGFAHDFNNLLTEILGNTDLAMMELPAGSPVVGYLGSVREGVHRAADLAEKMLAYSGQASLNLEPIDLSDLIRAHSDSFASMVPRRVKLKLDLGEDLPEIAGDSVQIAKAAGNLLTNAVEAIGDRHGTVRIITRALKADEEYFADARMKGNTSAGRYAYLEVADTGAGMGAESLERVFDPFYTTKFTGRGLGLAEVLGVVRGHSASIKVRSAPGLGTTFQVVFPSLRPGHPAEAGGAARRSRREGGRGAVLIVDGEESVRAVTARMLGAFGYEGLAADSLEHAIAVLSEHRDDVVAVLLDATLPGLSDEGGLDRIRRVRPGLPLILASAYGGGEPDRRRREQAVACVVQKPYSPRKLADALRRAVRRRR